MKRVTLVGGGIVGLATALQLARIRPGWQIQVLEKEARVGAHQSTHNSGVLHAGIYYKPGSLKARLAVSGIRKMVAFCVEHGIKHEICGKLVVATDAVEVGRLRSLLERGTANGLKGLRWLEGEELRTIEPHSAGIAAIQVPEEGIVDYASVCATMSRELTRLGMRITTECEVRSILKRGASWVVETSQGATESDYLINCAGLYSDRVAKLAGIAVTTRILPFRGEYFQLKCPAQALVSNLIYPVPDPTYPFLGVHFTRLVNGGVEAGPNAVLATSREGYSKWDVRIPDFLDAISFSGFWRFVRANGGMVWDESIRSLSKERFCKSLQKLVPEVTVADLEPGGAGVRAQAISPDGTLVQDFVFESAPNALHVLNAPSPGATASLAIGEYISNLCLERFAGASDDA